MCSRFYVVNKEPCTFLALHYGEALGLSETMGADVCLNGYLETWTLGTLGADKKSGIRVWKIRTLTVSCTIDTNV